VVHVVNVTVNTLSSTSITTFAWLQQGSNSATGTTGSTTGATCGASLYLTGTLQIPLCWSQVKGHINGSF
jgi:hypothetical protein